MREKLETLSVSVLRDFAKDNASKQREKKQENEA